MSVDYTIWTDGAFNKKHQIAGWGFYIINSNKQEKQFRGAIPNATSQMGELCAAIKALSYIPTPSKIHLISDSQYLVKGLNEWLYNWKLNDWCNNTGHTIKNKDMWEALDKEQQRHKLTAEWVRGHSETEGNIIADQLAVEGKERYIVANLT